MKWHKISELLLPTDDIFILVCYNPTKDYPDREYDVMLGAKNFDYWQNSQGNFFDIKDIKECYDYWAEIEPPEKIISYSKEKKNPYAVALGRLGGLKGGKARAKSLSKERRIEIAKKAVETRWRKAQALENSTKSQ